MLRILQKQIIVIIEGGITVVGEEVDGILSIPGGYANYEQFRNGNFFGCHQLYLCVE